MAKHDFKCTDCDEIVEVEASVHEETVTPICPTLRVTDTDTAVAIDVHGYSVENDSDPQFDRWVPNGTDMTKSHTMRKVFGPVAGWMNW